MLTKIEKLGGIFRDGGKRRDFLEIFKARGGNCIPVKGLRVWNQGATALFDTQGNVLPAVKAFELKPGAAEPKPTDADKARNIPKTPSSR